MKLHITKLLEQKEREVEWLAFILDIPEDDLATMLSEPRLLSVDVYFRIKALLRVSDGDLIEFDSNCNE